MANKWIGALSLLLCGQLMASELVIESWRIDDKALWEQKIIPAFEAAHPGIQVKFNGVQNVEYMPTLWASLKAGKAGDLITCRPFDDSLALFKAGHLVELSEMAGMENFPSFAQSPWQTDSGAQTFCVPMASVIHGFFYNKKIFNELGLTVPQTREAFFAALDKVKADGRYVPLAVSGSESWVASELGFQNIGPNYWKGEDGRLALIGGQERFNNPQYVKVFEELARWRDYLGEGARAATTPPPTSCSPRARLPSMRRDPGRLPPSPARWTSVSCARPWQSRGMAVSSPITPISVWG